MGEYGYTPPAATGGGAVDVVSNVATSTILGRTTSGSGDSEELTPAQVNTLLGGWQVLHDIEVGTDTASTPATLNLDVTGYRRLKISIWGRSDRNANQAGMRMTVNGNTGSVYSTDSGPITTDLQIATVPGALTNTDRTGFVSVMFGGPVGSHKAGTTSSTNTGSTATVGAADEDKGLFCTITAAITSVQLFFATGNWADSSLVLVEGLA